MVASDESRVAGGCALPNSQGTGPLLGSEKVIVMTAWRRPGYLFEALDSWSRVRGVEDYRIIVRQEPGNPAVHAVLAQWSDFLNLDIRLNDRHLGVRMNPWQAIDDGFEAGARFVVYTEDDVIVSEDILEMYEYGQKFIDRREILGIQGTQRWLPADPGTENTLALIQHFAATGWGTWIDRWYDVLRPGWENGDVRGWDWWILDYVVRHDRRMLTPMHARSQHIGLEEGTHMTPAVFDSHLSPSFKPERPRKGWRLEA